MSSTVLGLLYWDCQDDQDSGHRNYMAKWLAETTDPADGPSVVRNSIGLPPVGSPWVIGNDNDPWCFSRPVKCTPVVENEPNTLWFIDQFYTTKPFSRCQDTQIEDPMMEPARLSGTWANFTREAFVDRYGNFILTSSHEQIRGSAVEFDDGLPTVDVGINEQVLPLELFAELIHSVNDAPLWGLPARCVKFSSVVWRRVLYGTCSYYYQLDYGFDINYNTFDRKLLDLGTKILVPGGWYQNPNHFKSFLDKDSNPTDVLLDGFGSPWRGTLEAELTATSGASDGTLVFTGSHGMKKDDLFKMVWDGGFRHSCKVTKTFLDETPPNTADDFKLEFTGGYGDFFPAVGTTITMGSYGTRQVEKYLENNLLLLGIPTSLG